MLLALDIATNTGLCWGAGPQPPVLESNRLPPTGEDVGAFLCAYEDWLQSVIARIEPDLIVMEAPVLPRAKFNPRTKKIEGGVSLITTRKLQGLVGVTEMVAYRLQLPCAETQPAEVKQTLTGKGNAKKPEMVRACRAIGLDPKTYSHDGDLASDEADAFGVWVTGLREHNPAAFTHWEERLREARGLLI